jgi:putative membrane protein
MGDLLTEAERARIDAAVEEAERETSGEIVPVVVRASDDYPGARWRLAVVFTFLVAGVGLAAGVELLWLLVAQLPALLLGHALAALPPILRLALSAREVEEEVRQRALQAFMELGLQNTRDRTGVLVFVSLLEHRIEVVADRGIDEHAPKEFWVGVVARLGVRLKHGELTEGVTEAVQSCGRLLAAHFPRRAGDTDELPSRVVTPP